MVGRNTDMEGKRAVSRGTQIAMEAFVPWVKQQLDYLLGIPREDERQETVMKVKAVMDLWIRHQLNGLLRLQKTVEVVKGAELESKLDPCIRHRLNDMLLAGQQEEGDLVLGVKAELEAILVPRIKPQLNNLLEQQLEGEREARVMNSVKEELNRVVVPSIQKHLENLLKEHGKDEARKTVLDVKARLDPVLDIANVVLQNSDDERRKECEVWEWVDKVMDATYEAVDVLQELLNMSGKQNAVLNKVRPYLTYSWVKSIGQSASKIKAINAKLESLRKEANSCGYDEKSGSYHCPNDTFVSLATSPEIDLCFVCCRKADKKSVLEQLLPRTREENGVKVISIVGCGGSGKTALAQSVYNHPRAQQHFELRVWVSVSNVFDEKRIARDIHVSIVKYKLKKEGKWGLVDEKRILQDIEKDEDSSFKFIEESFSGKVFLCVFDDVWTEYESSKWMRLASLLVNGDPGSRILVTTRNERVARVVGSEPDWTHNLKPLSNQEWWVLWKEHMILNETNRISKKIETTGSEIAEKCHGWSLVAVALAPILMNNNTAEGWECELNKVLGMGDEMWRVEGVAQELFRHFYSSYYNFSPALKLCILYCADFDKGTVIVVDQLIRMWMAQGYLGDPYNETDDAKTLKGLEYFHDLASWGFFREFERGLVHKNKITSCKLDDTFHDFIRYEARHDLAALDQDKYIAVQEKRRDRHFHVASYGQVPDQHLSVRGQHIRALVLSSFQLEQVPSEVGCLSRLQYLDLSSNPLQQLPEAICNLHSLQFLDVHQCYLLLSLPRKIKKLKQLKHLRVDYTMDELHKHLPPGFEELTLIQTLDVFRTGGTYKDTMRKLKGFNDLRDICIAVHGEVNFSDADLHRKPRLVNLELCFVEGGRDQEKASKSVEEFKPPGNLKMLKFENYPLKGLPSWILEHPLINKLTRLSLKSAWNITSFPALWKLLSLEFLWLYDIPNLKHIGREFLGLSDTLQLPEMQNQKTSEKEEEEEEEEEEEVVIDYIEEELEITVQGLAKKPVVFPSLKTLRIERMKNLELWEDLSEDEKKLNDITVMPSLEELIIDRCPKLLELPLCILADTPWFKITKSANSSKECAAPPAPEENETAIEIIEPIVLPLTEHSQVEINGFPDRPAMLSDKDHCMKLKDVLQAYTNRSINDHFEVSIPKGVLGNVEVISCISFKYLNEWFKSDGRVFAEQLCIWSKLLYELMTPADKKRVQMVSSALITTVGRTEEQPDTRAEDLVNFMTNNKASLYLVPYLRPGHWELLAIVPEIRVIYRFDSLHGNINTELTGFLKMVERSYASKSPDSNKLLDSWRIVDIKHKKQTGYWECGYYVMIWMHKVAVNIQSLDLEQHFPLDESPYEPDELRKIAQKWCAYVLPQISV